MAMSMTSSSSRLRRSLIAATALLLLLGHPSPVSAATRLYSFDLVREYPHDPDAFTEGLVHGGNDTLFESTGLWNRSSLRKVHIPTGKVLLHRQLDGDLFGEGLTLLGDRLFQLIFLTNQGFIYDRHNFTKLTTFTHRMTDSWGLTTDGKVLFGSDGTSKLYKMDPAEPFEVMKTVTVKYHGDEVHFLNELEYIDGEVWANVWLTDCIVRVSPEDGLVVGLILLHELRQQLLDSGYTGLDVLNGIAWDKGNRRLFVTGKLWPKLYEIKLREVNGPADVSIETLCPMIIGSFSS